MTSLRRSNAGLAVLQASVIRRRDRGEGSGGASQRHDPVCPQGGRPPDAILLRTARTLLRRVASRRLIIGSGLVLVLLTTAFGFVLARGDAAAHRSLDERQETRVEVASSFVESYAQDVLANERRHAEKLLRGSVSPREFDRVVDAMDFQAAVLLGDDGRLAAVYPQSPDLLGSDFVGKYEHLDAALEGGTAISNVVPSAAEGIPIVAFATSYRDGAGTKVFSGAMDIHNSPLGQRYLESFATILGTRAYLIDSSGEILAGSKQVVTGDLRTADPALANASDRGGSGHYVDGGVDRFYASSPVRGTPWRFVLTVPSANLYAPIAGAQRVVPWVALGAFVLAAAGVLFLLWRTRQQATALVASNSALTTTLGELERSQLHLRKLEGILPICMNCKVVRTDDDKNWVRLDEYLTRADAVSLSHTYCPACEAKLLD